MTTVGKRIAAARARAKLTGKELGAQARVSASWVRSVETGRTLKPAPDKMGRVAEVLGLDHRELLAMTDQLGAPVVVPEANGGVAAAINAQTEMLRQLLSDRPSGGADALAAVAASVASLVQGIEEMRTENRRIVEQLRALEQRLAGTPEPTAEPTTQPRALPAGTRGERPRPVAQRGPSR